MITPKEVTAHKTIAAILWNEWDPIGINDIAPRDEYNSYISEILQLLKNGASIFPNPYPALSSHCFTTFASASFFELMSFISLNFMVALSSPSH